MVSMGTMLFINKWEFQIFLQLKKEEASGVGGSTVVIHERTFGGGICCHRRVVCKWVLE
jgi:hypothetical protein